MTQKGLICHKTKQLTNQITRTSGIPKNGDSKAMFQAIEANPTSRTWRVSGKFGIL